MIFVFSVLGTEMAIHTIISLVVFVPRQERGQHFVQSLFYKEYQDLQLCTTVQSLKLDSYHLLASLQDLEGISAAMLYSQCQIF